MSISSDDSRIPSLLLLIVLVGLTLRVWYASEALSAGRFVDEKYSLLNIESIVTQRTLEPASSYYPYPLFNVPPAALVAICDALYRRTEDGRFRAFTDAGFGAATYLICRLLQTLYGALALFLTFLLGRKVFSTPVGLLGAFVLAFAPWHIHASGYFKPDTQLTAMVLLALVWSLDAIERPTLNSHILAGLAIALAMSSKLTGGLAAVPLVVGVAVSGWRDFRRWGLLAISGTTTGLAFILLNPYWRAYPAWLDSLELDYAMRATRQGMSRSQIPGRVVELMTDRYVLGPTLGTLSLVAFLFLLAGLFRDRSGSSSELAKRCALAAFPLAYVAAYAWKTAYFKANNFLPLVPLACLLAAWSLVRVWQLAAARFLALQSRTWQTVALTILGYFLMSPGFLYAYRSVTPTTVDASLLFVSRKLKPRQGRVVFAERVETERPVWEGGRRFGGGRSVVATVDSLDDEARDRLDLSDGEIFAVASLKTPRSPFYQQRIERVPPRRVRIFEPRPFVRRGPAMVAVKHPFDSQGKTQSLPLRNCSPRGRCFAAQLPNDVENAPWISLVVSLRFARGTSIDGIDSIRVADRRVPLRVASQTMRGAVFVTERFAPPVLSTAIRLETHHAVVFRRRLSVTLHRWQQNQAGPPRRHAIGDRQAQ